MTQRTRIRLLNELKDLRWSRRYFQIYRPDPAVVRFINSQVSSTFRKLR